MILGMIYNLEKNYFKKIPIKIKLIRIKSLRQIYSKIIELLFILAGINN